MDEYQAELHSRKLEWTPPHLSEQFWKQNAGRLSENNCELIKILVEIIQQQKDAEVLAIAASDIGQFAKFASNPAKLLNETGAKAVVMNLMAHDDPNVRYQALSAVQKIMLSSF